MLHDSLQQFESICKMKQMQDWINEMSNQSKGTYQVTKTVKPSMKWIKCKFFMHCQHYAKTLTQKQREKSALARVMKTKKERFLCSFKTRKLTVPQTLPRSANSNQNTDRTVRVKTLYLLTHCGVFKVHFTHNNPVYGAHTLSFRDVSEHTKVKLHGLFDMGHNASLARHALEQQLIAEAESPEDQQKHSCWRSPKSKPTRHVSSLWQVVCWCLWGRKW